MITARSQSIWFVFCLDLAEHKQSSFFSRRSPAQEKGRLLARLQGLLITQAQSEQEDGYHG